MDIYVVQEGDTIDSIALAFNTPVYKIIQDNGLENADNLVTGQTIVIVYPTQTYTVQESDTLESIARNNNITLMQLLRNNSFLTDRDYIYPGEILVISYDTSRELSTNGFVYPYINENILKKTLPYLTFLSVFNYRISDEGEIISFDDDVRIIQTAKIYGTIPLLMISALSPAGEPNVEVIYEILINEEYQNQLINNVINIMQTAGYQGLNIVLTSITTSNFNLYINFLTNVSNHMNNEGFFFFLTVNPNIRYEDDTITFNQLDYGALGRLCYQLTFLQYYWGINTDPPTPVSSITLLRNFMDYVVTVAATDNISLGKPLVAYDWALPYISGRSVANAMTLNSAISLASDTGVDIQFDKPSQTPYFYYFRFEYQQHIVWSIGARSISAIDDLIIEYNLIGSGIWNIMIYYQQMWTIINVRFDILKFIPDQLQ